MSHCRPDAYRCYDCDGAVALGDLLSAVRTVRRNGGTVVTTNGCFDLLHAGHVRSLRRCRSLGDLLIVGLNSDASVRSLKGDGRPLVPEEQRATLLANLRSVDYVLVFDELLPNAWLDVVRPAIHCKSGDYVADELPEAAVVRAAGGRIEILPLEEGLSTSEISARLIRGELPEGREGEGRGLFPAILALSNELRGIGYRILSCHGGALPSPHGTHGAEKQIVAVFDWGQGAVLAFRLGSPGGEGEGGSGLAAVDLEGLSGFCDGTVLVRFGPLAASTAFADLRRRIGDACPVVEANDWLGARGFSPAEWLAQAAVLALALDGGDGKAWDTHA